MLKNNQNLERNMIMCQRTEKGSLPIINYRQKEDKYKLKLLLLGLLQKRSCTLILNVSHVFDYSELVLLFLFPCIFITDSKGVLTLLTIIFKTH